jgi:hypothetical protein
MLHDMQAWSATEAQEFWPSLRNRAPKRAHSKLLLKHNPSRKIIVQILKVEVQMLMTNIGKTGKSEKSLASVGLTSAST